MNHVLTRSGYFIMLFLCKAYTKMLCKIGKILDPIDLDLTNMAAKSVKMHGIYENGQLSLILHI